MSKFEAYTKLESWLLFRELLALDAEGLSFSRAADFLAGNEHVQEDPTFDPTRLTPDALHAYFLHLIAVEYGTAPALPSSEEYHSKFDEKIPALATRLYNEYSTGILVAVREDERRLNELAREIREEELKMKEEEEQERKAKVAAEARQAAAATAAAAQSPPALDLQLPPKPNGRKPSPPQTQTTPQSQPTPVQAAPAQTSQDQPPQVQAPSSKPPLAPPMHTPLVLPPRVQTPTLAPTPAKPTSQPSPQPPNQVAPAAQQPPPAQAPVAPRPVAPSPVPGAVQPPAVVAPTQAVAESPAGPKAQPQTQPQPVVAKPPNGPPQVLQPPVGVGQPPPRAIQSTSPAPLPAISPRPDVAKPKTPVPVALAQAAAPGTLKWEKPYQPPIMPSQGRPVPPNISPAPQLAPGPPGQPQHLGQQQHLAQPQHAGQQQHAGQPQHPQHPGQPQHPAQWQQQHPNQQPHFQPPQAQGPPQTPQAAQAQRPSPVLMPPQPPGQLAPPMHAGAGRPVPPPQPRQSSTTPIPAPVLPAGQARASPAQQQPPHGPPTPVYHNRPIAAATSAKPPTPVQQAGVAPPPPRWSQQHQAGQYTPSQFTPAPAPPNHTPIQPATADSQRRVGSPYANQPPRPALPPHIASQLPRSPSPAQRPSNVFAPPKTPVASTPTFIRTGSGTKWKPTSTVSTPTMRPSQGDMPSPAYEPLSPVQTSAKLLPRPTPASVKKISPKPEKAKADKVKVDNKVRPEKADKPTPSKATPSKEVKATPSKDGKPGRPRGRPPKIARDTPKDTLTPLPPPPPPQLASFAASESTPSRAGPSRRSQSILSQAGDLSMDDFDELTEHVKNEAATPRPPDETGDTTADESGPPGRRQRFTPGSVSSRLAHKRKRQDSDSAPLDLPPPPPLPPASTPTHVLWTRQFGRISSSALDQISSHRCANQFAHPIRERDAPGYKGLVLQPQDIKSIRAAMTHGNRAAGDAAKALPDGDPGTPMVWLPISDDLLPPKSIINSEQLERELVHMFSNAIMYNLDPHRGPGSAFVKRDADGEGDDAEPSTYLVDEDAVVRDSRTMFLEVERLLGELRNAERKRSGNPPSGGAAGGGAAWAPGSSATATPGAGGESTPTAAHLVDDDLDELAGEEGTVATVKRRRIGTRA